MDSTGGGSVIANAAATDAGRCESGISLLFRRGTRPTAADVGRQAKVPPANRAAAGFFISHRPDEGVGWLELLASGLTFDLSGLGPGGPASPPPLGTAIGLKEGLANESLEAVHLAPGGHLAGGEALLPIVRVHLALALALAGLPGLAAISWHPARTWIAPDFFERTVSAWLEGGVFPALGLTALVPTGTGNLLTEGLAFFIGRELQVPAGLAENDAETAKLAMRLIHHMVQEGRDHAAGTYSTEQGQSIEVRESGDDRYLEVCRSDA
jgi:hypothetical protein